jgi:hypothetical protein
MDKTYKSRLAQRKSVLDQHHDIVVAINNDKTPEEDPRIRPAISELYNFVLETYLPTRYPSMFELNAKSSLFQNLVTGATWPTTLSPTTPTTQALEILAQTVDEDFLILLPELSSDSEEQPRYVLQAYATCFPAGFNTREKLGLRLADIHGPVPRYQERIGRSMDKFFARIEVGKFVKRFNWSITINTGLFAAFGGTHAVSGVKEDAIEVGKLNIDQVCWLLGSLFDGIALISPRRFSDVSVRHCIGYRRLRLLFFSSIPMFIRLGRLRMRVLVRTLRMRSMA